MTIFNTCFQWKWITNTCNTSRKVFKKRISRVQRCIIRNATWTCGILNGNIPFYSYWTFKELFNDLLTCIQRNTLSKRGIECNVSFRTVRGSVVIHPAQQTRLPTLATALLQVGGRQRDIHMYTHQSTLGVIWFLIMLAILSNNVQIMKKNKRFLFHLFEIIRDIFFSKVTLMKKLIKIYYVQQIFVLTTYRSPVALKCSQFKWNYKTTNRRVDVLSVCRNYFLQHIGRISWQITTVNLNF